MQTINTCIREVNPSQLRGTRMEYLVTIPKKKRLSRDSSKFYAIKTLLSTHPAC